MNYILTVSLLIMSLRSQAQKDKITDTRDSKIYPIVLVDSLYWFAKNLNYKTGTSICPDSITRDCNLTGMVYDESDRYTACPKGWRLPTKKEFSSILNKTSEKPFFAITDAKGWETMGKNQMTNNFGLSIISTENIQINKNKNSKGYIESTSFWLDTSKEKEIFHVHIRYGKIDLHSHYFPLPNRNKFSIRCVCEKESLI